ncbi:hypothetical protein FHS14_006546 [Paenibacillus baekrokdamisoli]|uniref:hypothetical protein n=1 Tax=Paenibacillus baekrokdamisoli TaxID=1712516 RepID=UPI000F7B8ED4|nr:hypothetical protein [Paenibacillus baekrokdamisoli]MBB3073487.1 hypothetical protein [Paenibacillus baekrokdamisoli]
MKLRITPYYASGHSALGSAEVRSGLGEVFQQLRCLIGRAHPHHLTASRPPFGLKVVGRREYKNVS